MNPSIDIKIEHLWHIDATLSIIEGTPVLCSGILLLMTLITRYDSTRIQTERQIGSLSGNSIKSLFSSAAKENTRLFLYSKIVKPHQTVKQPKHQLLSQLMLQLRPLLQNRITMVVINHGVKQENPVQVILKTLTTWTDGIFNTSRTRTIMNINFTLTERKMSVPRTAT